MLTHAGPVHGSKVALVRLTNACTEMRVLAHRIRGAWKRARLQAYSGHVLIGCLLFSEQKLQSSNLVPRLCLGTRLAKQRVKIGQADLST